jgi:hypothetical protein
MGKVTSTTRSKPGPVIVASVLGADYSKLSPEPGQLSTKPRSDGPGLAALLAALGSQVNGHG